MGEDLDAEIEAALAALPENETTFATELPPSLVDDDESISPRSPPSVNAEEDLITRLNSQFQSRIDRFQLDLAECDQVIAQIDISRANAPAIYPPTSPPTELLIDDGHDTNPLSDDSRPITDSAVVAETIPPSAPSTHRDGSFFPSKTVLPLIQIAPRASSRASSVVPHDAALPPKSARDKPPSGRGYSARILSASSQRLEQSSARQPSVQPNTKASEAQPSEVGSSAGTESRLPQEESRETISIDDCDAREAEIVRQNAEALAQVQQNLEAVAQQHLEELEREQASLREEHEQLLRERAAAERRAVAVRHGAALRILRAFKNYRVRRLARAVFAECARRAAARVKQRPPGPPVPIAALAPPPNSAAAAAAAPPSRTPQTDKTLPPSASSTPPPFSTAAVSTPTSTSTPTPAPLPVTSSATSATSPAASAGAAPQASAPRAASKRSSKPSSTRALAPAPPPPPSPPVAASAAPSSAKPPLPDAGPDARPDAQLAVRAPDPTALTHRSDADAASSPGAGAAVPAPSAGARTRLPLAEPQHSALAAEPESDPSGAQATDRGNARVASTRTPRSADARTSEERTSGKAFIQHTQQSPPTRIPHQSQLAEEQRAAAAPPPNERGSTFTVETPSTQTARAVPASVHDGTGLTTARNGEALSTPTSEQTPTASSSSTQPSNPVHVHGPSNAPAAEVVSETEPTAHTPGTSREEQQQTSNASSNATCASRTPRSTRTPREGKCTLLPGQVLRATLLGHVERTRFKTRSAAATRIQALWRGHRTRRRLRLALELVRSEQKRLFGDEADRWAQELADGVEPADERARTTLEFFARLGLSADADGEAAEPDAEGDRWLAEYASGLARDPQKIAIALPPPLPSQRQTHDDPNPSAPNPSAAPATGGDVAAAGAVKPVAGQEERRAFRKPPSGSALGNVSVRRASNPTIETPAPSSGVRRPVSPALSTDCGSVRVEQVTDRMGRPPLPPLALHQPPPEAEGAALTTPVGAVDRDSLPSTSRASSRKIQAIADDWGFKNPMTAELAYKRAHKLKYAAEKRRKQRSMDANDRLEWLHRAEARNRERFASIHHSEDALRTPAVPEDVASNLDVIGTQNPTTLNELSGKQQMRERILATYEWLHNQVVIPPSQDAAPVSQPAPPSRPLLAHQPNRGTRPPQQLANTRPHWPTSTTAPAASGAAQLTSAAGALFGPVATRVLVAPPRPAVINDGRSLGFGAGAVASGLAGSANGAERAAAALPPIGQFCTSPPPTPSRRS